MPANPPPRRRAVLLRVSPWGGGEIHGGQLRSQQIAGLVRRALPDARHHDAPHPRALPRPALLALAARGAAESAASRSRPAEGFYTAWVDSIIAGQGLGRGDLVIFDADQRYGPALVRVAARRGLRVIALPHNIESLIPYHFPIHIDVERVGTELATEVRWLARANSVWAIGRFDQELFQLFGIAADLLPYAPPAPRAADLLEIRARRIGRPSAATRAGSAHLLILGTAHNPPTRTGMIEQIAMLQHITGTPALPPVIIAGYGTQALAETPAAGVTVLGSQTWPQLQQLLVGAAALWVHQAPMSGALTRIPEALIAGVPVLANGWAARGHAPMAGMQVYADTADFCARLQVLPTDFPPPDSTPAEDRFVAALRAAVGA